MRPRLLNLRQGAAYLGLSYWTIRDYVLAGLIPVVQLPPLRPREGDKAKAALRRVLIDVEDLDAFIARSKTAGAPDSQSAAGLNSPVNPARCTSVVPASKAGQKRSTAR